MAHYSWDPKQLCYKGRIVLVPNSTCIKTILQEMHSTLAAGHSEFLRTYKRIKQNFYWVGMKNIIAKFVAQYDVCQRYKGETVASPGKLQPLPILDLIWIDKSMDFIEGLPSSQGKGTILSWWIALQSMLTFALFVIPTLLLVLLESLWRIL